MIFSIGFTIIFGLIIFGVMYFINRKKDFDFRKFQIGSGYLNLIISLMFLFMYFGGSGLLNATISNPVINIIFTVVVSYFYILLAPISMGNIIFLVNSKTKNRFYYAFLNGISCVITTFIIPLFLNLYY